MMILLASGRCDIPAFYSEWFLNRLKAGFLDVRNPYNEHQISRIDLHDKNVDGIAFCTKNPIPMMSYLEEIYLPYLFHITITPYQKDIEPGMIDKHKVIKAIQELSQKIGKERVLVRYDPILITSKYTIEYHERAFERLCVQMQNVVSTIIISFVDDYKNVRKHREEMEMITMNDSLMKAIAKRLGPIAKRYGIVVQTCAESINLQEYGIMATPCFERHQLTSVFQREILAKGTHNVRQNCACLPTVDIGDYNCCSHHCKYCYANYDEEQINLRRHLHHSTSSVLIGELSEKDIITKRKEKTLYQESLF